MSKRKTNQKAGASSTIPKRTEDPPTTFPEYRSSNTNPNSKANKRKSTIPNYVPKNSAMPDPTTTPLNPGGQQRTTFKAPDPHTTPVLALRTYATVASDLNPQTGGNTPSALLNVNSTSNPTPSINQITSPRTLTQDHITSLKLSTKDMEVETLRLQEILAAKKAELQEKKRELMGRVKGNEFGRRWREVKKKRGRAGGE
jgi:hypothetical protein